MQNGTSVPMKIWRPDGTVDKTLSITNLEDHLGNDVAEGRLPQSEFYPQLVKGIRNEASANWRTYLQLRNDIENAEYSRNWVGRWLDDTMP